MTVPSTWQTVALADISRVYSGGTPSRAVSAYWGGEIPWVSTAEVNGPTITSTKESITEEGLARSAAKVAPPGTLVMAMYGQGKTRGKTSMLGIEAAMNQACAAIEPHKYVDPTFLLGYLQYNYEMIRGLSNSGGQENLSGQIVKRIPILLPGLPEQRRIATVISDIWDQETTLERLIAKKHAVKQGMMQQLLTGRTRLPGFNSEWSGTTIGEVSEFLTGHPFESASFAAMGIRLIRGSNVKRGEIDWSPEIAKYWAALDPGLRVYALRDGDIVIAMDGALVGRSFARITNAELPAYLVQRVARLRGKTIDQDLLYQWIGSRDFAKHVDDVKTHTAIPHISPRDIRDFNISIPVDVNEQRAIAEVLRDTDIQIELLKSRLAKARNTKTGMLQQLLTGRTRLPLGAAS